MISICHFTSNARKYFILLFQLFSVFLFNKNEASIDSYKMETMPEEKEKYETQKYENDTYSLITNMKMPKIPYKKKYI